jgi:hypothetical protein
MNPLQCSGKDTPRSGWILHPCCPAGAVVSYLLQNLFWDAQGAIYRAILHASTSQTRVHAIAGAILRFLSGPKTETPPPDTARGATADLCDVHYVHSVDVVGEPSVQIMQPVFMDLGGKMRFAGQAATVKCFENNPLVRKVCPQGAAITGLVFYDTCSTSSSAHWSCICVGARRGGERASAGGGCWCFPSLCGPGGQPGGHGRQERLERALPSIRASVELRFALMFAWMLTSSVRLAFIVACGLCRRASSRVAIA